MENFLFDVKFLNCVIECSVYFPCMTVSVILSVSSVCGIKCTVQSQWRVAVSLMWEFPVCDSRDVGSFLCVTVM